MKKIFFMNLKVIMVMIMAASITLFSSCLKDSGPVEDFSNTGAIVGFQYTGNSFIPFSQSLLPQPNDSVKLEVTLSVSTLTLKSPVTVTIAPDQATLDTYNSDNGTDYQQLGSNIYSIKDNGTVTIGPGQQIVTTTIVFDGSQIDFNQDNALALKITDAQGASIATNLNKAIYLIKLRNIYEGHYDLSGQRILYAGPTAGSGVVATVPFSGNYLIPTVDINSVTAPFGDLGGLTILVTIDPVTNLVTISDDPANPSGFTGVGNDGAPSTWDPATKTFDLHYKYLNGAGNLRHLDETLTYTGF